MVRQPSARSVWARRGLTKRLDQQFLDHIAADVRKAKITALEFESQLGMVEA